MPSKYFSILLFLLPFASAAPATRSCNNDASTRPTATIDSGPIAGTTTTLPSSTSTVNKFLGIPFAAPPVRFSPPKLPESWEDEYDASSFKSSCIQKFDDPEGRGKLIKKWLGGGDLPEGESEDCLYLNVFAPSTGVEEGKEGKTVLLWIYGGTFAYGASSLRLYDGSWLADGQDVVVVTFNYRINVFGFPGSPDLPDTEKNLG
jgi:carboxylesterase type B